MKPHIETHTLRTKDTLASVQKVKQLTATHLLWSACSYPWGGNGTGLGHHVHQAAWTAVIHGVKWFSLKPPAPPSTETSETTATMEVPEVNDRLPQKCVQGKGDLLYIPRNWEHAVTNHSDVVWAPSNRGNPTQPVFCLTGSNRTRFASPPVGLGSLGSTGQPLQGHAGARICACPWGLT